MVPFVNLKGGVGKTTTLLGIAEALARAAVDDERDRVLVIDLDPQANLTQVLAPGLADDELTVSDVLREDQVGGILQAIRPTSGAWGNIDLVPSEIGLANRETEVGGTSLLRLRRALRGIESPGRRYAYILVDCNPSVGMLTINALAAATAAIVVAEAGLYATKGIRMTLENAEKTMDINPDLTIAGIIVNKLDKRSAEEQHRLDEMRSIYGDLVWSPVIPARTALKNASGAGIPVQLLRTSAATEIAWVYDELAARLEKATR